jgi:hypothetical protein
MTGSVSSTAGLLRLNQTIGGHGRSAGCDDHDAEPRHSTCTPDSIVLLDRLVGMLLARGDDAEEHQRTAKRCRPRAPAQGLTPAIHIIVVVVSPTTLPAPPAFEAATMAAR